MSVDIEAPPLRLGFASTPRPHSVGERMGAKLAAGASSPRRSGERWRALSRELVERSKGETERRALKTGSAAPPLARRPFLSKVATESAR